MFNAQQAVTRARGLLATLMREPPAKPVDFLPRPPGRNLQSDLCDSAVYMMKGASEPDAPLPAVRRMVYRLQQIRDDGSILCPCAEEQKLRMP